MKPIDLCAVPIVPIVLKISTSVESEDIVDTSQQDVAAVKELTLTINSQQVLHNR